MRRHLTGIRGGLLVALAAVSFLLADGVAAPPSARAQATTPPSLRDFVLEPVHKSPVDLMERVELLDAELPKRGVQNILATANREGESGPTSASCNPDALNDKPLRGLNHCFNDSDSASIGGVVEWMPQGITTVADAQADQRWGEKQAILVSWYDRPPSKGGQSGGDAGRTKGCRVTFLDPATRRYRHVLLAYPYMNAYDNPSYMSLRTTQFSDQPGLHCGGMVWYGNHLYVADTAKGFRVFDMRYIFDLGEADNGSTGDPSLIGRHSGVYHAHGYRFVMPQVAAWRSTARRDACDPTGAPSFSFVGLDRSTVPDALTTGEYCDEADYQGGDEDLPEEDKMGRVARWPLDGSDGSPQLSGDGLWRATQAYQLGVSNIQGALSLDGRWYLSRSRGPNANSYLYVTKPISSSTGLLEIDEVRRAGIGVEDLSYWAPSVTNGAGWLYTITEHPGRRMIYACDLAHLDDDIDSEICGAWPDPPS